MNVLTSSRVTDVKVVDKGVEIVVETKGDDDKSSSQIIKASHLLVAVGRRPMTADVGLEGMKVELDKRKLVKVNEFMQTGESWVYAIGDIVDTSWLAHVASKEGILAVDHMKDK